MAKTGNFTNRYNGTYVDTVNDDAVFTTSYDKLEGIILDVIADSNGRQAWQGNMQVIVIQGTIASAATTLTVKGTIDPDGDICIIPPTEITLEPCITTAGDATAVFQVEAWLNIKAGEKIYLWGKTDAGTFTSGPDQAIYTWRE